MGYLRDKPKVEKRGNKCGENSGIGDKKRLVACK